MQERGISDKNSPEYKAAEKEWNRLYYRNWHKKNKGNYVIIKLMLRKEHYQLIARLAKQLNLPIATLVKNVVIAYTQEIFYTPPPKFLKQATVAINRISNLINQQTRYLHTVRRLSEKDYQFLLDQVASLREKLNQIFTQPVPLKDFLQGALKKGGKAARDVAQDAINQFDNDNKGNIT